MAVVFDGVDDYNTYVQDAVAGFAFTIPVTMFLRYRFDAAISGSGVDQPICTVAEPTAIATSGSSFQIGKNAANQIIAKCQRVGDPGGWAGVNTAASTAISVNSWHSIVAQFDASTITLWTDSGTPVVTTWNKNNGVVNLSRFGAGGVYLFGAAETNVKPYTGSAGLYYGAGQIADVGVLNGVYESAQVLSYHSSGYSCPKMFELYGGSWKYMLLDTLPAGTSASIIPNSCYGQSITYSNYTVDAGGTQSNGPTVNAAFPALALPSVSTLRQILGCRQIITNVSTARRIGV